MPNLLNVVFKNSSVIALLPPTNIVMPLRGGSETTGGSGELGACPLCPVVATAGVVFEVEEETKLLYKFCKHSVMRYYDYKLTTTTIGTTNTENLVVNVEVVFGVLGSETPTSVLPTGGEVAENG